MAIISIIALIMAISILIGLVVIGVPFISSPKKDFDTAMAAADIKPGSVLCDLGCGKANLLVYASKKYKLRALAMNWFCGRIYGPGLMFGFPAPM